MRLKMLQKVKNGHLKPRNVRQVRGGQQLKRGFVDLAGRRMAGINILKVHQRTALLPIRTTACDLVFSFARLRNLVLRKQWNNTQPLPSCKL